MTPQTAAVAEGVIRQVEEEMKNLGMTKKALADSMGVTPGYVSHLFLGRKSNMTLETLLKLTNAVGLTVEIRLS